MINILEIFKDFYFTKYLFFGMGILGLMLCLKKFFGGNS